jgi:hypothetical protein
MTEWRNFFRSYGCKMTSRTLKQMFEICDSVTAESRAARYTLENEQSVWLDLRLIPVTAVNFTFAAPRVNSAVVSVCVCICRLCMKIRKYTCVNVRRRTLLFICIHVCSVLAKCMLELVTHMRRDINSNLVHTFFSYYYYYYYCCWLSQIVSGIV